MAALERGSVRDYPNRWSASRSLLLPAAWVVVLVADTVSPRVRTVGRWPPLARVHAWIGRLPPFVALPLFLVPEVCSRSGWLVSAWLLIHGEGWRAMAVYAATKLIAGSLALWIYSACLPALLRVRPFATLHAGLMKLQRRLAAGLGHRPGGSFTAAIAWHRARRGRPVQVTGRNAASGPAPATSSVPTDPSRTG